MSDPYPDLQPDGERQALEQLLDHGRSVAAGMLDGLSWAEASSRPLTATDLTVAGIVRHLAWAEDRWFQGRLLGVDMPDPWLGDDDPDRSMRLRDGDSVDSIARLYQDACTRSRQAAGQFSSLDAVAAISSFGKGPVNLRWILAHMIDETARHNGHLDLLTDALQPGVDGGAS